MTQQSEQITEKHYGIVSIILRVFWMLLGNVILLFSVIFIFQGKDWQFHTADVFFWSTVAAMVLFRYLDIKFYNGLTSMGEPASIANWRKYAVVLLICSTVIWALAHIINYIVVNK